MGELFYRDYMRSAKKTYFNINVTKGDDKHSNLFAQQLVTVTKCINRVANTLKKRV